jgi:hypothetical protein
MRDRFFRSALNVLIIDVKGQNTSKNSMVSNNISTCWLTVTNMFVIEEKAMILIKRLN